MEKIRMQAIHENLIYVNVGGITDLANQWKYMEG